MIKKNIQYEREQETIRRRTIDWKIFKVWFDVEFHSVLIDPTEQPISKEEW